MNVEDYVSDNTLELQSLRAKNEKLSRQVERDTDEIGDLNIKILQLRARIKELEAKYEGGQP